jgi:hypothetical protein
VIDAIARRVIWTIDAEVMTAQRNPGTGAAFVVSGIVNGPCPGV